MKDASYELQSAIYTRLNGNIGGFKIFNGLPSDGSYPAISFRVGVVTDRSAKSSPGETYIIQFDCWSKLQNDKEVSQMFDQILQQITTSADPIPNLLTTTNFNIVNQFLFNKTVFHDIDGRTRHGVLQIEIQTQEK